LTRYTSTTEQDRREMLDAVGVPSLDDLFATEIPDGVRLRRPLELPDGMSEQEVFDHLAALAARNRHCDEEVTFLGAGMYDHYVPALIDSITQRSEFLTPYTPYQPEVSQGTLQGTFEFQTLTAQLFGMEVSNAGMYDGATSLAEAALMACRVTKRRRVAVVDTVHRHYIQVVRSYVVPQDIEVYTITPDATELQPETACVLAQYPNFFGYIEDQQALADLAHDNGALYCVSCDPIAMAMLKPPGAYGADLATREGPAHGVPPSLGGPDVGK
jgi:glycine dehydrogenase subunit 1